MLEAISDQRVDKPVSVRVVRTSIAKKAAGGAARLTNRLAVWLFFSVVALAPLPFGSGKATSVVFWCICLAAAAAFSSTAKIRRPQATLLIGMVALLIVYGIVIYLQMAPHQRVVGADPVWSAASKILATPLDPTVSITRSTPYFGAGTILANCLALILGLVLGSDRHRARHVLLVFAWSGLAYAIYGIVSALIEPGMILWRERPDYYGNVLGTFINRNTAASYFGSCAAVWLLILCESIKAKLSSVDLTWSEFSQRILEEAHLDIIVSFAAAFICIMALFMTNSRAGVLCSLTIFIAAIAIFWRRSLSKNSKRLWFAIGAVCIALGLLQFLGGTVNQRFDAAGFSDEGRLETYRSTLRLIADHPWLGTGLDTFVWAFPQYRSPSSMYGIWDMAHSTPLQLAAEMGIPLAVTVALAWLAALIILIRGVLTRRRDAIIPLSAAAVASIGLLQSSVDFSLQIPGYAIVVMAVVGAGLAQSFHTTTSK